MERRKRHQRPLQYSENHRIDLAQTASEKHCRFASGYANLDPGQGLAPVLATIIRRSKIS
jgi:hypothetical protein